MEGQNEDESVNGTNESVNGTNDTLAIFPLICALYFRQENFVEDVRGLCFS